MLTFELHDDQLIDRETGTGWDMVTGRALTPPLSDQQLKKLPGIVSFAGVWNRFHVQNESAGEE